MKKTLFGFSFKVTAFGLKESEKDGSIATYTYQEMLDWTGKTEEEIDKEIIPKIQIYYNLGTDNYYEGGISTETVAETILDENKKTIEIKVTGTKDKYEIIGIEIPGKEDNIILQEAFNSLGLQENEEDEANIGGILLSPVFYLVNFIFDAITSNLGSIMMGEGVSAFSGFKVLTSTMPSQYGASSLDDAYQVNVKSFGAYQYPNIKYTPEEIFAGKVDLLSIDFISGKNFSGQDNTDEDWLSIRSVISSWYKALRMIAIIGLLSVLIYTGIKIIISANAKDKAKYKEWIINWFMAVVILFTMHYIMSFVISVTGEVNKLLDNASGGLTVKLVNGQNIEDKDNDGGQDYFVTNLMGLVRFMIQSENFYIKVGYEIMYIALLIYTLKFTIVYLKRVLNMAFLTLIAPIVALTYPIDKINDGRAQGFDMWLKEYVFNALLQPMHYIMYYILVGSAVNIAASNPLYGIVVLMFMTEAEKLLKKIFGFDKAGAGTVGGMTGAFAAGALASNIKNIARMAKLPGGNGGKGGPGGADKNNTLDNPKPTDKPSLDEFSDEVDRGTENQGENSDGQTPSTVAHDNEEEGRQQSSAYGMEGQQRRDEQQQQEQQASTNSQEQGGEPETIPTPKQETGTTPIRDMAKRIGKGSLAVAKSVARPIYDFDKSFSYNGKRFLRNVGRGVVGATMGVATAAVQAGISITDGKYNAMEGMASFTAGYAGGGQIARGFGGLIDTYKEGASAGDKKAQMKRAKERFADRDDVIAFNKKNYPGKEKKAMEREREHYLTRGVTDLKEMKSGMRYADALMDKNKGMTAEQADRRATATIDFRRNLQNQGQLGAVYNQEKQEKYIKTMLKGVDAKDQAKVRKQYENAFKAVAAYDAANS